MNETELREIVETQEELEGSLYKTAKYFCGFNDITWNTHGKMIEALEDTTTRKMIVTPRGGFKTSICAVAYPVWRILRNPNIRILIDSELFTNSKNHLRQMKDILSQEIAIELYGKFESRQDWAQSHFTINQRTESLRESTVTAGGLGTRKIGQHYDAWILDDMNSPQNVVSKELAQKVIDHYKYGLSILEPDGTIVLIGTRYGEADLIQHILDNEIEIIEE